MDSRLEVQMSKKQKELFTPRTLAEFARERVVVRAFLASTGSLDSSVILAACAVGEAMIQVTYADRQLNCEFGPAVSQAGRYLTAIRKICGAQFQPPRHFLYERVHSAAALIVTTPYLDARKISPSVIQFLPLYGALDHLPNVLWSVHYGHGTEREDRQLIAEFRRRFSGFLDLMVSEAVGNLSALVA